MKQISITTVNGVINYALANGAPLPSIKAGNLIFHAKTTGLQSIPLAQLVEYEVESVSAGTKSDRLKADLAAIDAEIERRVTEVHEAANECALPTDALFADSLRAYFDACTQAAEKRAKAEKFFERRAKTLAKREAEGMTKRSRKSDAAPAPSPTAFASDEPVATPTPKARKAAKK